MFAGFALDSFYGCSLYLFFPKYHTAVKSSVITQNDSPRSEKHMGTHILDLASDLVMISALNLDLNGSNSLGRK